MKQSLFNTIAFLTCAVASAQIIDFPDPNFKARLINWGSTAFDPAGTDHSNDADTNNDGEIEVSEALAVKGLYLWSDPTSPTNDIVSLEGIQYFTNVVNLNCLGNKIENLDLSAMTGLQDLNCSYNNLQNLNIANLTQLTTVWCNNNNLSSLDVSGLTSLDALFCHENQISALDFDDLDMLRDLKCSANNFTSLDVTPLSSLEVLVCEDNQLTSLTVNNTSSLIEIVADTNLLTSLEVSNLDLHFLSCSNNQLTGLDVQSNSNLFSLKCNANPILALNLDGLIELTHLEVSQTQLTTIDCSQSGVLQLIASDCPNLTSINVKNNNPSYSDPDMLYFTFQFENLPALTSICVDNGEQNNLAYTNYNSGGNAVIYTGLDCDIVLTLGIDDVRPESFKLYPNPATTSLTIESGNNRIRDIAVYNMFGQMVKKVLTGETTIDISDLQTGSYLIQIATDKGKTSKKLVKF